MDKINIFWFRRDLRYDDNCALFYALKSTENVIPIFIFDTSILEKLEEKKDKRVSFIFDVLQNIQHHFKQYNSGIQTFHDLPINVFKNLCEKYAINAVFANEDYEPYAIARDNEIQTFLAEKNIAFHKYKDQVIFSPNEILKSDGTPFTIYTPYSKRWLENLSPEVYQFPSESLLNNLYKHEANFLSLEQIGFIKNNYSVQQKKLDESFLKSYAQYRDFPSLDSTSGLSVHLRFGTVSIRKIVQQARQFSIGFLKELIWREFFMSILYHFPHSAHRAFRPQYDNIIWENNPENFDKWCNGNTGFPLVDAGMRQLNATGLMHNRVRMLVASFLVKDLHIDWRLGEAYFASKLLDYEMSSNVGNWQWAAGTGCDAAPYFRVFNPNVQLQKFDKNLDYVKQWIPEYGSDAYASEMVNHDEARLKTIEMYKKALNGLQ